MLLSGINFNIFYHTIFIYRKYRKIINIFRDIINQYWDLLPHLLRKSYDNITIVFQLKMKLINLLYGGNRMAAGMNKQEMKQAKKDAKALLKKPFYKKVWFWILAIIVVIIIANLGGEETPKNESAATGSTEKATPAKEKAEEKVFGIGEVVKVGDVEFTVNSTSTAKNVGGEYGTNAQGTYLLLDVTVKNVGNEAITTDTSFFKLLSGEKTYDADGSASIYANEDTNFFLEQVNPDLSANGVVAFDVTDEVINNPELMVQVSTGFFGTEKGTIKVAK